MGPGAGGLVGPGNVGVVTGGASGIGRAVAEAFVAAGMRVVLADIDAPKLRDVEARLTEDGAEVATRVCDTASEGDIDALAEYTVERFGAAHVVFNNAGIGGSADAWSEPMAVWHRVVDVNLFGVVHGIRAFLPIMQQQQEGHIVNTASMAGLGAVPTIAPYVATKHAVVGLSESLFLELQAAGSPVGVSVLCPGFVKTDIMDTAPDRVEGAIAQAVVEMLRAGVDDGMPASEVARQVVEAIGRRQFWILTHDDVRHDPVERMQRAASGDNPVPPIG